MDGLLSVKWNSHGSTFLHMLSKLHDQRSPGDATVACNGRVYPVHTFVLSTCSSYFSDMFSSAAGSDKYPVLVIQDVSCEVFEALLKYMYTGEVNVQQKTLAELVQVAESLQIKGLVMKDFENYTGNGMSTPTKESYNTQGSSDDNQKSPSYDLNTPPKRSYNHVSGDSNDDNGQPPPKIQAKPTRKRGRPPKNPIVTSENTTAGSTNATDVSDATKPKQLRLVNINSLITSNESDINGGIEPSQDDNLQPDEIVNNHKDVKENPAEDETEQVKDTEANTEDNIEARIDAQTEENMEAQTKENAEVQTGELMQADAEEDDEKNTILFDPRMLLSEVVRLEEGPALFCSDGGGDEATAEAYGGAEGNDDAQDNEPLEGGDDGSSFLVADPSPLVMVSPSLTSDDKTKYQCSKCDYSATLKASLLVHERRHTGESDTFKCSLCDYNATQSASLMIHMRRHTGEKPFSCLYCDYSASQKQSLTIHMRRHTGEKPYSCEYCDYRSAQQTQLRNHMRRHTGEKPFACDQCDYRSSQNAMLTNHMRRHTGQKPFSCPHCDYSAAQRGQLALHMKHHHGKQGDM